LRGERANEATTLSCCSQCFQEPNLVPRQIDGHLDDPICGYRCHFSAFGYGLSMWRVPLNRLADDRGKPPSGFGAFCQIAAMSALPPKADIPHCRLDVRFVPQADSCTAANRSLFDHLVGNGENARRDGEPERFGGSEVDHQVEFSWLHYWQIGGFLTLENPASENPLLPANIRNADAIANQTAGHSL
jgi:hypothetical protein